MCVQVVQMLQLAEELGVRAPTTSAFVPTTQKKWFSLLTLRWAQCTVCSAHWAVLLSTYSANSGILLKSAISSSTSKQVASKQGPTNVILDPTSLNQPLCAWSKYKYLSIPNTCTVCKSVKLYLSWLYSTSFLKKKVKINQLLSIF